MLTGYLAVCLQLCCAAPRTTERRLGRRSIRVASIIDFLGTRQDNPRFLLQLATSIIPAQVHQRRLPPQSFCENHITMKTAILTFALATIASAAPAPLVPRAPPNVPTTAAAKTQLAGLTVAAQGPQTGYSRDLFPHWITQSGMKEKKTYQDLG